MVKRSIDRCKALFKRQFAVSKGSPKVQEPRNAVWRRVGITFWILTAIAGGLIAHRSSGKVAIEDWLRAEGPSVNAWTLVLRGTTFRQVTDPKIADKVLRTVISRISEKNQLWYTEKKDWIVIQHTQSDLPLVYGRYENFDQKRITPKQEDWLNGGTSWPALASLADFVGDLVLLRDETKKLKKLKPYRDPREIIY